MVGPAPASLAALLGLPLGQAIALPADVVIAMVDTASDAEVAAHPAALLVLAWVLEPSIRLADRRSALDRASVLTTDPALLLRVEAERAVDLAKTLLLDEAEAAAIKVLAVHGDDLAAARATEALGRVHAWRGTPASAGRARQHFADAASAYSRLGADEWQGNALFWAANTLDFQLGEVDRAEAGLRAALPLVNPARRALVLTFLGDLLAYVGRGSEAADVLDEAIRLAGGTRTTVAYAGWSRARLASYADDAQATVRLVEEVDRDLSADDIRNTVATWRADASELLHRVGEAEAAETMLRRAEELEPDDEFVRLARATALTLYGDPEAALQALRQVLREPWLERRLLWRNTLLTAWATLRSGRPGAGELAAHALEQAGGLGGTRVAVTTERRLVRALAPLAALAGSQPAAALLDPSGTVVRLLGDQAVLRDGVALDLPPGQPGELARLTLSRAGGVGIDEAVEALWPGEDADDDTGAGRRRLRQVLFRLSTQLPGVVVRAGERLVGSAWVDLVDFEAAAGSALALGRTDRAQEALARWGGTPLPMDAYAGWAADTRERLLATRVRLLDLLATDAEARGDLGRAVRLLEDAIADDPYDEQRYLTAARLLLRQGRRGPALGLTRRAGDMLRGLGIGEPDGLRRLREEIAGGGRDVTVLTSKRASCRPPSTT